MWIVRICLDVSGENFSPKALLPELSGSFIVFSSHEPADLMLMRPGTYEYGCLSILAPSKIAIPEHPQLADYENWYLDFIEQHKEVMARGGVTEINLVMDVFHSGGQCNFEIFSKDGLKKIGRHGVALPISFYSSRDDQIVDLLRDAKYPEGVIKDFVDQG